MAWFADSFRLVGGFLFWNARKTLYRRRGGRGRCPCQHPSDSGRAWETGCHAITHWNEPARFRRICPLLLKNPDGLWRCSVDRADVRPFWGRAFAFYGGGLATLYLLGTLAAFTALRTTGYQVTYPGVLWPPAWSKFTEVKSEFFYAKFQRAYAAQDIREALLDLALAYDLDPRNYDAGFRLAQLYQAGQPALSDRIYHHLLVDHPEKTEQTSQAFFRALLARGDLQAVQTLAHDRILESPGSSPAWLNAFLFANRRTGDTDALALLARETLVKQLPADVRTVLNLAAALRTASPEDVRQLLISGSGRGADGYTLYFICRQLITQGFPQVALGLLDQPDTGLGVRDRASLHLDALAAQGWTTTLENETDLLLAPPPTAAVVELFCTHLIRWPDEKLFEKLAVRLRQSPLPRNEESYSAYLAFFCAAGVARDEPRLNWSIARLNEISGTTFASLKPAGEFFLGRQKFGHLGNYLPTLQPLPLETTYALIRRYIPVAASPRTP